MRRRILKPVETDEDLTLALGTEKCRGSVLSLADCFALALARRVGGGTLLTTHSELGRTKGIGVKYLQIE
ncbi:MAG: type II toxin-antitoxin system VapC family toxin [Thaumarchaeota archaeon]|nr:MAG: type II toxin-antitoxin system VapC family toxin [Nitrososphaerota archaeon]